MNETLRQPLEAGALALGGALLLLAAAPATADWSRFRGPDSVGIADAAGAISKLDSPHFEVVWKIDIGSGYSGVAVGDGRVFTFFSEGEHDVAAAFDHATGKRLWSYQIAPIYKGHDGSHDGPITTPLIAHGRVFGIAPRGQFFALDAATGKELWRTELSGELEIKKPHYGFGTSPILEAGNLIVQLGGDGKALGGFDPATGKLRWQTGDDGVSYQAPITITVDGQRQVVAAGDKKILAVDPSDGKIVWQHTHDGSGGRGAGSIVPVPAGDGRFFLANKDDGSILIEVSADAQVATGWDSRAIRNSYNVPVFHDGHLYAYSSRFLTSVDAATGDSTWRSRQPGDGFLILVDGHLLITTKKGRLELVNANSEAFEPVTGIQLFDEISWTSPSFTDGQIYARSLGELARVDLRSGPASQVETADQDLGDSAFGAFLETVEAAAPADKKAVVDSFFAEQENFPVIEGDRVHFIFRGDAKDVAVAGDMFGARREEAMTQIPGTDVFYWSWQTEPDARLNYLFIKDFEETIDELNPRRSATTVLTKEMEMSFAGVELPMSWWAMPKWQAPDHLKQADEAKRGQIVEHQIDSKILEQPIAAQVYLPAGYQANAEQRYPVIYHHDPAALARGNLANSLDNLIHTSAEPVIAVFLGIRARGPKYGQAFIGEVLPFIDGEYRTLATAEGRANHGNGFTAINALISTFMNPTLFSKVAVQSPFLFTGTETMTAQMVEGIESADQAPLIYLDWGKYDLRNPHEGWDMSAAGRRLAELLAAKGIAVHGGEVNDGTDWANWQNRTHKVVEALFPLP